jgi:hypothetical protein
MLEVTDHSELLADAHIVPRQRLVHLREEWAVVPGLEVRAIGSLGMLFHY